MPSLPPSFSLPAVLLNNLAAFQAFARKQLGDAELAADVVQDSLLKALKSSGDLEHEHNLRAWFYRILRNTILDLHKRRATQAKALEKFAQEMELDPALEGEQLVCECFRRLLPSLRADYAEVLQLVDLDGCSHEEAATRLSVTRNHLKVRLHRARQQLRERLQATCQLCATHGCLDCTCDNHASQPLS